MLSVSGAWVSAELDAVIVLYATMRGCVDKGLDYNKAAMIRWTRTTGAPLAGRSRRRLIRFGSLERQALMACSFMRLNSCCKMRIAATCM